MAGRKAEIEALKERVARIAPENVPDAQTPDLRGQFAIERGMSAFLSFTEDALKAGPAAFVSRPSARPAPVSGETRPAGERGAPERNENPPPAEERGRKQNPGNEPASKIVPEDSAPPGQKAAMSAAAAGASGAADDDAVSKVHEDHKEWVRKVHNYDVGGMTEKGADDAVNDRHGVRKITIASNQNADAKKNKKKQADDTMRYLLLQQQLQQELDRIDAEIDRLNARIAKIDKELDQIDDARLAMEELEELQAGGRLDPDNPRHAALLRRAGIDPAQARQDGMDAILAQRRAELDQKEQALKAERDRALEDRQQLQAARDKLAEAKDSLDANPDSPAARAEAQEVYEQIKGVSAKIIDQRVDIIGTEAELFAEKIEQIDAPQGSPEYIAQVDAIIDGMTKNTKWDLLESSDLDESIKDRVRVDIFEDQYKKLDAFKAEPEKYQRYLERMVEKQLDPRTKQLLLENADTPEDVRAALEREQSAAIVAMDEGKVQKFMQSYAQATSDADREELRKLAESLTPEERTAIEGDPDAKAYLEELDKPRSEEGEPIQTASLAVKAPSL